MHFGWFNKQRIKRFEGKKRLHWTKHIILLPKIKKKVKLIAIHIKMQNSTDSWSTQEETMPNSNRRTLTLSIVDFSVVKVYWWIGIEELMS